MEGAPKVMYGGDTKSSATSSLAQHAAVFGIWVLGSCAALTLLIFAANKDVFDHMFVPIYLGVSIFVAYFSLRNLPELGEAARLENGVGGTLMGLSVGFEAWRMVERWMWSGQMGGLGHRSLALAVVPAMAVGCRLSLRLSRKAGLYLLLIAAVAAYLSLTSFIMFTNAG